MVLKNDLTAIFRNFQELFIFQKVKSVLISSELLKKNFTLGYLGENDLDPDFLIFVFSNLIFRIVDFDTPVSLF